MSSITSFVVSLLFISSCLSLKIPSFIPRCCREDPNLGKCFINSTNELRKYAKTGYKDYGIPPLSPLFIPQVNFEQSTDNYDVKVILKNATIIGLDTYNFTKFSYDPKNYTFRGHIKIGSLNIKSYIDFQGEVLQIKLIGTGDVSGVSDPTEGKFAVYGKIIKNDGVDYFQVVDGNAQIKKLSGKVNFENFVSDNPEYVAAINDIINSNAQILVKQLRGPVETLAKQTIMEIVNGLAGSLPYDEVFPHCEKQ